VESTTAGAVMLHLFRGSTSVINTKFNTNEGMLHILMAFAPKANRSITKINHTDTHIYNETQ